MQLAISHLGYQPNSPKIVTLCPGVDHTHLPDRIPFYLRQNCFRMEESFAIGWNTLEHWDVPYAHAINAIAWL